jgi:hypothetical protein
LVISSSALQETDSSNLACSPKPGRYGDSTHRMGCYWYGLSN